MGLELSRVIRARYENGVLRPLEPLELREGEEVKVILEEDIIEFARRIRKYVNAGGSLASYSPRRGAGLPRIDEKRVVLDASIAIDLFAGRDKG